PVVWSMYPNGLDPSPVAATTQGGVTWVARVRPRSAEPGAPRALELGTLSAEGTFAARDELRDANGKMTDVAVIADPQGAVWVTWRNGEGSWLERVACR
ncbi:MAG: hypothetical protein ACRELB_05015, partial [Polyangiaceae bacterium]